MDAGRHINFSFVGIMALEKIIDAKVQLFSKTAVTLTNSYKSNYKYVFYICKILMSYPGFWSFKIRDSS